MAARQCWAPVVTHESQEKPWAPEESQGWAWEGNTPWVPQPGHVLPFGFSPGVWFHPRFVCVSWAISGRRADLLRQKSFPGISEGGMRQPWLDALQGGSRDPQHSVLHPDLQHWKNLLSVLTVLEKPGNVVIRVETTKNAWHPFYSLEVCLGLGQGDGFNAFAHEESRDAELKLSNIP